MGHHLPHESTTKHRHVGEFCEAEVGKSGLSTKMVLTTEVSAGTEAHTGPRTDWWSEKESLEIFYQLFITNFYEKIGSNMTWNDWSWHPTLPLNTTYNPSHSPSTPHTPSTPQLQPQI